MADGGDWLEWLLSVTPKQESTSVPPVQVDLTYALKRLHKWLPSFCERIVIGEIKPGEWQGLAIVLEAVAAECRRQEPRDVDSGS